MSTKNLDKEKIKKNIEIANKLVFNSKLFIDLNINEDIDALNENSENNTEGSDNSFELEESNYLSNELIEELDSCDDNSYKKTDNKNIVDSLLSLANNGYEFTPKNYKLFYNKSPKLFNNNSNNKNYNNSNTKNNMYCFNNNNLRDPQKDWICSFCNNLNYSFRTKCNRCKISKEESNKRNNVFINNITL